MRHKNSVLCVFARCSLPLLVVSCTESTMTGASAVEGGSGGSVPAARTAGTGHHVGGVGSLLTAGTTSAAGAVAETGGAGGSAGVAGSRPPIDDTAGGRASNSPMDAGPTGPAAGEGGSAGQSGTGSTAGAGGMAGAAADGQEPSCALGSDDGTPVPMPLSLSGNIFAHDPTMIESEGTFYRFWTGDNLPAATSTDLMRWSNAPAVYRDGYPAWSREWLAGVPDQTFNFPWAPDVSHFGDVFHLYSSFSARFGANISCITHLTTADLASNDWTDHGPVICSDRSDRYNAIDADVGFDADGQPWLAFGSFWDGIMLFPLNEDGSRKGSESPARIAWAPEIEAPVLFKRCEYFYLFVSHGICCPGPQRPVSSLTYRVVVGRANDIRGPYVDKEGKPMLEEGGSLIVEGDRRTYAAAGHSDILVVDDRVYHTYHAYRLPRGDAELRIVEMRFDADGWPIPTAP